MGIRADAQQEAGETAKLTRVTSLAPARTPGNGAMNSRNFFAELKRRKVYKVGIAYAVVAWVLMQVASQIFPFFAIPNWAVRLVVLLLIIGFPVALILAWAFELTPEGIRRTEDVDRSTSSAFKTRNLTVVLAEGPEKKLRCRLLQRTGAWCWTRKANRERRERPWRNFAAFIGDPFIASYSDRVLGQRMQRISPKDFSRCYWSDGTMTAAANAPGGGPFDTNEYGLWQREPGSQNYSFHDISYAYDEDGTFAGSGVVTANVSLTGANSFTYSATLEFFDPDGNLVFSGCGRATGTRFE